MRKEENDIRILSEAPIPAAVAGLAVPTVITQLINIFYNYADTWFVGRTGNPAAVAAMSVCMPLYVLMAAIANLFGIGGARLRGCVLGRVLPAGLELLAGIVFLVMSCHRGIPPLFWWIGLRREAVGKWITDAFSTSPLVKMWKTGGEAGSFPTGFQH